jgi:hypothetical protein
MVRRTHSQHDFTCLPEPQSGSCLGLGLGHWAFAIALAVLLPCSVGQQTTDPPFRLRPTDRADRPSPTGHRSVKSSPHAGSSLGTSLPTVRKTRGTDAQAHLRVPVPVRLFTGHLFSLAIEHSTASASLSLSLSPCSSLSPIRRGGRASPFSDRLPLGQGRGRWPCSFT